MKTRYSVLMLIAIFSFVSLSAQITLPVRQLDTTLLVGATAGNANVSSGGAAMYSIPIFVSPGTAGVQPNITIAYNSQVSNGVLGTGWNIAGLSAITRVPKDYYHDATVKGVSLTSNDRFEWDGNRLVATLGTYGSNGTVYGTEAESFANIVSNNTAGTGPESFTVTTKEGTILTYGATIDSRIEAPGNTTVLIWRLNQMKDINGNYINYTYTESNGDSYISRIDYTGNSVTSLSPYNAIIFIYEDRPDKSMYYLCGIGINQTKRLTAIDMISENVPVRHYTFTYLPIATYNIGNEKSRLSQIQETGTINGVSKAINPTVINWGANTQTSPVITISNDTTSENTKSYFSDLNGDGRTDQLILGKTTGSTYYTRWYYYQSDGNTLIMISSGNLDISTCTGAVIADMNNDGKNEILLNAQQNNAIRECHVCKPGEIPAQQPISPFEYMDQQNDAINFEVTDSAMIVVQPDLIVADTCCSTINYTFINALNYTISNNTLVRSITGNEIYSMGDLKILPGQINSDGKTDLLVLEQNNNISMGNQKGFTLYTYPNFNTPELVELVDFDGDGLQEVFVLKAGAYSIYKFNEISSFTLIKNGTLAGATDYNLKIGDFNGDGKTDIVLRYVAGNKFSVYLSTGTTFTGPTNTLIDPVLDYSQSNKEADFNVLDLNADGRDDIAVLYTMLNDISRAFNDTCYDCPIPYIGSPALVRYYSDSDGKLSLYTYDKLDGLLSSKAFGLDFGDFDGDGMKDAALMMNPAKWKVNSTFNGEIYSGFTNLQKYRVISIVNGLNQATGFTYISLAAANSSSYSKGKSSVFPLNDIQPAQFVVASLYTYAGYKRLNKDEYSVTDFTYKGARTHLQGKGYLGFDTLVRTNNLSGIKTESCFGINTPYYFRYPQSENTFVAGTPASTKTSTFVTQAKGGFRYYSYPSQSISTDLVTDSKVKHDYTFDAFGNMIKDIATVGSNTTPDAVVTTTNSYIAKPVTCVLNRIKSAYVISVYTGQPAFTTKKAFTYDTKGNCLSVIDSTNQAKPVTTSYSINMYGLPVSVTVSAAGITSRTSRTDYDTKYRMAIRSINALGYKSKLTFNYALGIALSDSAANGLNTYFTYDEFGRLKSTLLPQGYSIMQSMAWAKSGDPAGTICSSTVVTPGKPTIKAYYDILGRAIRSESTGFDNKTVYSDLNYVPAPPYGKAGMLTSQTLPYYTGETTLPVKYKYDAYGRVTAVEDRGMTTQTNYTGKTVTATDVAGRASSKTVNSLGNVTSATDNGGIINYVYHSSGQPLTITAVGAITTIAYDINGRQKFLTDPDAGLTSYTYNAFGELASQTNANGYNDTLIYDILGRVTQKKLGIGTVRDVTTYVYNNTGKAIGQLASVTGANGVKQEFIYETNYGWLSTISQTIPGTNKLTTSYLYDSYGNNTRITYPETGFAVTNEFDKGRLIRVRRTSDNSLIWQLNTLSSHGLPLQTAIGNGLLTNYGYTIDQLTQITTGTVQNEAYTYSNPDIGNLSSRMDSINAKAESFTYDNLDRLTGITYMAQDAQITYSGNGNISNKYNGGAYAYDPIKVHAVKTVTKTAGTTPQTLQNITYTKFNKAENIQQWTPVTNKLLTYAITYGPDEQRVKTIYIDTVGTKTYRFYAGNYEKDSIVVGSTKTVKKIHYITGGTGLVAVYIKWSTGQDSMFYVCNDRQGSITALLKQNGTVSERYSYDAWGRRRNPANWTDYNVKSPRLVSRGYTGHEHLDGFGLINMNGRMYDPVIGRVLSPDAFVQAPGYTQSYNRYSYCMNNPLKYTDPSGWLMAPLGSYWNLGAEGFEMRIGNYEPPSLGGGGFSTPNWSNEIHDEYTNFMLMGSRGYDNLYGNGATDIARGLVSDPTVAGQWREGLISIGSVRQAGGYWTQSEYIVNRQSPESITINGSVIVMSTNTGPGKISQHWVAVNSLYSKGGNIENDGFDITQKIIGAVDFTVSSTYAAINAVQNLGYGKVLVKLGGKEIANKIPLVTALISVGQGMQNGFKTSNYVDIGLNVGLVVLDGFLLTNPVGWVITAGFFGADLYCEYNYGESWTEHAFNHN